MWWLITTGWIFPVQERSSNRPEPAGTIGGSVMRRVDESQFSMFALTINRVPKDWCLRRTCGPEPAGSRRRVPVLIAKGRSSNAPFTRADSVIITPCTVVWPPKGPRNSRSSDTRATVSLRFVGAITLFQRPHIAGRGAGESACSRLKKSRPHGGLTLSGS